MTTPFVGTATVEERLHDPNVLWKAIAKRTAQTLRSGLPGKIITFDASTQYATVRLMITENIVINEVSSPTAIPDLQDVLILFPGDNNWAITFPSLVGAECYVCFADMCINAWSTNGPAKDQGGSPTMPQNQEVVRRHDLSDGFAILSPRSQPNVIQNYSTTALEIRSLDNTVKIALQSSGITVTTPEMTVNAQLLANILATKQTPFASSTSSDHSVPIVLNGITYYMRLSTTP
jgi:hypothetical protein